MNKHEIAFLFRNYDDEITGYVSGGMRIYGKLLQYTVTSFDKALSNSRFFYSIKHYFFPFEIPH